MRPSCSIAEPLDLASVQQFSVYFSEGTAITPHAKETDRGFP